MSARAWMREQIESSVQAYQALLGNAQLLEQVEALAQDCVRALRDGHQIVFAGNGGSFADAQHMSAELTSRFKFDRAPLASVALGTNSSAMSAIGNDYGYEQVFARELRAVAKPGDVFIPITTSGKSPNIVAAVRAAREMGIRTVAFTGEASGDLTSLCDCLRVPAKETARIQECHILVGHLICGLIESLYFKPKS